MKSADSTKKITDIVARHAFQISEARGFTPGHDMEDWQRAESEIVVRLCGGWTVADGRIVVTTTASVYKEGPIEICVEPRRLAIFGKQRASSGHETLAQGRYDTQEKEIVRVLDLPVEVDPSGERQRDLTIACWKYRCPKSAPFAELALTHVPLYQSRGRAEENMPPWHVL